MRKVIKNSLLLLSLSLFSLSVYQSTQHWDYEETLADLNQSIRSTITKDSILSEIQLSIAKSEFDDARMYLDIAKSNNYPIDYIKLGLEIDRKDTKLRQITTQTSNFAKGFFKGKSSNIAGIAGSVTADFTVIGDARDLSREYGNYQKGESVNELIVLLSGAGIGLTALTIGTGGGAGPAKVGSSVIKLAVKTQRITRSFQKHLIKLGRQVFNWPIFTRTIKNNKSIPNIRRAAKQAYHPEAIAPLKKIANRVNRIRKSTSTVDTVHLLKYIHSPKDLIQLEKISLKYGTKTKGMMKLLGKGALRSVKTLKKTTSLLISLLSTFISGLFSVFLFFTRRFMH